ncbi:MAG TPA: hypothetical protein VMS17_27115 [Gemmataceae bacterium]|nr:hypothetical protein [Gemmataceae bacterium]
MSEPRDAHDGFANQAVESLTAEADQLRQEAARLRAERDELRRALDAARQEKAAIAAERDDYKKSLYAVLHEDWTFTEEEIADLEKNGVTLDDKFFEDLEREMRALEPKQ